MIYLVLYGVHLVLLSAVIAYVCVHKNDKCDYCGKCTGNEECQDEICVYFKGLFNKANDKESK